MRVFTLLGQLGYVKLYSNILPHAELGMFFYYLNLFTGFTALIFYPLDQYQQSHAHQLRRDGISLRSFLPANFRLLAILVGVTLLVIPAWHLLDGVWHWELVICLLLAQATHIVAATRSLLNILDHKGVAAAYFAADALAKAGVLLLLSWLFVMTPLRAVGSAALAMALVGLALIPAVRRTGLLQGERMQPPGAGELLHFAIPISAAAVLTWIQLQGFRFMAPFGFADTVGVYTTVASVGSSAVLAVSPILIQMYQPEIFKTHGAFTSRYLLYALGLVGAMALGMAMFAPLIVRILTNASFVPYAFVALFGIGVEGSNVLLGGLFPFFNLRKQSKVIFTAGLIAFVVSGLMLAAVCLFHRINPYTIGSAIFASQFASVLFVFVRYRRVVAAEASA